MRTPAPGLSRKQSGGRITPDQLVKQGEVRSPSGKKLGAGNSRKDGPRTRLAFRGFCQICRNQYPAEPVDIHIGEGSNFLFYGLGQIVIFGRHEATEAKPIIPRQGLTKYLGILTKRLERGPRLCQHLFQDLLCILSLIHI